MTEIIAAFLGAIATILVWYLSSRDLSRREKENKRREIRPNYLIKAYQNLEAAANRPMSSEVATYVESAIADIQLFGSNKQAQLAQEFAKSFAESNKASYDTLLDDLRIDLRNELDLGKMPPTRRILRIQEQAFPNKRLRA